MRSVHVLMLAGILAAALGARHVIRASHSTLIAAVNELLEADHAFSSRSSQTDLVPGLTAMFSGDVVMLAPGAELVRGAADAAAALRANKDNAGARAEWTPVRGGISADAQHGFTVGYMSVTRADGTRVPLKYLAYWIRKPEGWRVAVYKRTRTERAPASPHLMAPALPPQLVPVSQDGHATEAHRKSLDAAERAFSDEAQTMGIGPAFEKFGSADAINLGPAREPALVVGSAAIGRMVGAAYPAGQPGVTWAPETVIVASSGDLGVTIGRITRIAAGAEDGSPSSVPFFTIWRRARVTDPWRYVAE